MKPIVPLSVSIKRSGHLLVIQSAAHALVAGAVLAATLPSWLMAVLLLSIGASLARARRISAVASLALGGDGQLQIIGSDGAAKSAVVHPHTLVLSSLVVLLYRQEGRLRAMTLLGDSLAAEDFRQLRLWLRWRSSAVDPA